MVALAVFTVSNSTSLGNSRGIEAAGTNATMNLFQSRLSGNTTGWYQTASATIYTFKNNVITDTSNTGVLTNATAQ